MTTAGITALLAKAHWQMFLHRTHQSLTENRLLTFVVCSFLVIYTFAAYFLVSRGLYFVQQLPLLGPLLTERLIYLLFFFFLIMLVLSNATITGMSLFRRRDAEWQIALPIPPRSLVLWRTLEGMAFASWGLIILSAPILVAIGRIFQADYRFYLIGFLGLVSLVMLAANASTWVLLGLVRWARRWWWKPAAALAVVLVVLLVQRFSNLDPDAVTTRDLAANLNEVMRHTEICMHPLLPSAWLTEALLASSNQIPWRTSFYALLLLSYALASFLVTAWLASRWFPPAWQRVMTAAPIQRAEQQAATWYRSSGKRSQKRAWWQVLLVLDQPSSALVVKDVRTFLREPVQWGQCAIIFGLLFFYAANLRRLGYENESPFWITVISYLNLVVCSLALSTLTTRFIFPQFSLEGQRLWIVGMSPVPLHRILGLKLRLAAGVFAVITTTLILVSSASLKLPFGRTLIFAAAIILLSYGLTALALAIGAILPNFKESNPARIVSGFGGTICLILSFIYICLSIIVLLLPEWERLRTGSTPPANQAPNLIPDLLALGGVFLLTLLFGTAPFEIAKKLTKKLEYLKEM
jgi:ABC-2 type transport system permease protein